MNEKDLSSLKQRAGIVGYGDFGRALGAVVSRAGFPFSAWDEDGIKSLSPSLSDCVSGADVVFFAVPTNRLREALTSALPFIGTDTVSVMVSKGLDGGGLSAPEIAEYFFARSKIAFLGGPMTTTDILSGRDFFPVIAGEDRARNSVAGFFPEGKVVITFSEDVKGVAFSGILKNFYAFLLGYAEGSELSEGNRAGLFVACAEELWRAVEFFGGEAETARGAAGLGDLKVSASLASDNFSDGVRLAKRLPPVGSESVQSAPAMKLRLAGESSLPLLAIACDIITRSFGASEEIIKIINGDY